MNKLQEEFKHFCNQEQDTILVHPKEILDWINQNYISKEQILENLKDIEIGEFEGWDLAHKFNCCPGDDMADAYNQALKDVIKLIKKL